MKTEVNVGFLVKRREAAAMLSMSIESFERYVEPKIKLVQVGSMFMVPVAELQRYVADNATFYGTVQS
jgi:hypothetical protein